MRRTIIGVWLVCFVGVAPATPATAQQKRDCEDLLKPVAVARFEIATVYKQQICAALKKAVQDAQKEFDKAKAALVKATDQLEKAYAGQEAVEKKIDQKEKYVVRMKVDLEEVNGLLNACEDAIPAPLLDECDKYKPRKKLLEDRIAEAKAVITNLRNEWHNWKGIIKANEDWVEQMRAKTEQTWAALEEAKAKLTAADCRFAR